MLGFRITNFISFLNQKKYPFYFFVISVFFVIYALLLNQIKSYTKLIELLDDLPTYILWSDFYKNIAKEKYANKKKIKWIFFLIRKK